MDDVDGLRSFLASRVPEYEPASLESRANVIDGSFEGWLAALQHDVRTQSKRPLRSHGQPVHIRVAGVDPNAALESTLQRAAPRDAVCCLDTREKDSFNYWILISRSLVHDLYFLLAAVELGPSRFIVKNNEGTASHVDVRAPDFLASGDAAEPLRLTCVALEFVFLHELAHAIRGHIPYLQQKSVLPRACLCEIGALADTSPSVPQLHQAVELDADLTALAIQLHYASRGKRASSIVDSGNAKDYARRLGFSLGVVFRAFELWRRDLRGAAHDPLDATHPHPDVREVLADAWLAQRTKEPGGLDTNLCDIVRSSRDAGREALERLGPRFLPMMTYLQQRGKQDVVREIELLRTTLYQKVRPELELFTARR